MNLRFATASDLPALTALINRSFKVEAFFIVRDRLTPEEAEVYFRKGRFLLGEENGSLAGVVYVEMRGERGYFGLLSVEPTLQKSGVGRRLIAAAEEFAREMGAHHMDITVVNLRTELPPFYRKLGYTENGTEPVRAEMVPRLLQPAHFIRMTKPLGEG
ncbi:MAG TPA: GNAT family N-acetyltransferase [Acidobacteriaceae bacterium]|nr:GNAT family N-acetyltransferase [Acidobacteriaceae bacterium]